MTVPVRVMRQHFPEQYHDPGIRHFGIKLQVRKDGRLEPGVVRCAISISQCLVTGRKECNIIRARWFFKQLAGWKIVSWTRPSGVNLVISIERLGDEERVAASHKRFQAGVGDGDEDRPRPRGWARARARARITDDDEADRPQQVSVAVGTVEKGIQRNSKRGQGQGFEWTV